MAKQLAAHSAKLIDTPVITGEPYDYGVDPHLATVKR